MRTVSNIVVYHPAAIGDALLATPVATTLKLSYPAAKLTYWTHPELRPLLGLCPAIDATVDYCRDANLFENLRQFGNLRPDLFVDLSNSSRSRILCWFSKISKVGVVRYQKNKQPTQHATDNFLDTIRPVCQEFPDKLFPTIFPSMEVRDVLAPYLEHVNELRPLLGIVPGVGKHRPHRGWVFNGWLALLSDILSWSRFQPVLIGGADEIEFCQRLNDQVGKQCLNVAGTLSLPQSASVLKNCIVVISGDTGPAHLAVAVGTKVIGLYGPTFPTRSGPYGCEKLLIDRSAACQCHEHKTCRLLGNSGPGACMQEIGVAEVLDALRLELAGRSLRCDG